MQSEDQCYFVSPVGLSLACDQAPEYRGYEVKYGYNLRNQAGELVFVMGEHLPRLMLEVPKFRQPIVIVCNGSDEMFPDDFRGMPGFENLLGDKVAAVYIQNNCATDHPKFRQIPIGIDYHTLFWNNGRHPWGEAGLSALQQERTLMDCLARMRPIAECDPTRVLTNFQHAASYPERRAQYRMPLLRLLQGKDWMMWLPEQTREEFWLSLERYAFVLSPPGAGMDTHRAWEALALGRIPIVQDLPINKCYEGLPIWVVRDWDEFSALTREDLRAKHKEFVQRWDTYDWRRLTLQYWRGVLHSHKTGVRA